MAKQIRAHLTKLQGEQEINFIVTFDQEGISGHPNHIAVHKGVAVVFEEGKFPFDVLTLVTVGFIRKYMGYGDIYNCGYDHMHYVSLTPYTAYRAMALHAS